MPTEQSLDVETLTQAALKLPHRERVELMERLAVSLEGEAASPLSPAWRDEIRRRIRDYEEGRTNTIPAEEVFRSIRERLNT